MKKFFVSLTIIFVFFSSSFEASASSQAKAKAMISMAAYGTAGGALLGFASMAFGTKPINIARGASLGLYAGILFGAYVVLSYTYKNSSFFNQGDYSGEASPYQEDDGEGAYGAPDGGATVNPDRPQLWVPENEIRSDFFSNRAYKNKKRHTNAEFSMNVMSFEF